MEQHQDLACKLAPHMHALSSASATLFNPLTSVVTTLVSELASLRVSHEQLQERVSRFETYNQVSLPHSIPPPPNTTPPETPVIDLTQPPAPFHHLTQSGIHHPLARPLPVQTNHQHQPQDSDSPLFRTTTHVTSGSSPEKRLRRKRRSSKRPISDSATSPGRQENHANATELTATPAKTPSKAPQLKSSDSSMVHEPATLQAQPTPQKSDGQPMEVCQVKSEPQEDNIPTMKVLPTTPTTNEKPKKRRTDPLTNDPAIEGYKSVAAAVQVAENIIATREAENCPPAFRTDAQPGRTCAQCQNLFRAQAAEALDPHVAFQALLERGCCHQERISTPPTPEGYWALDFSETPTQSPPQNL